MAEGDRPGQRAQGRTGGGTCDQQAPASPPQSLVNHRGLSAREQPPYTTLVEVSVALRTHPPHAVRTQGHNLNLRTGTRTEGRSASTGWTPVSRSRKRGLRGLRGPSAADMAQDTVQCPTPDRGCGADGAGSRMAAGEHPPVLTAGRVCPPSGRSRARSSPRRPRTGWSPTGPGSGSPLPETEMFS